MSQYKEELAALYDRVPRRHSADNVKEIISIVNDFETILGKIEGINSYYEKKTADLFSETETVRAKIKASNDNKASKKNKDVFFDEASGILKDGIQTLIDVYGDGSKTE